MNPFDEQRHTAAVRARTFSRALAHPSAPVITLPLALAEPYLAAARQATTPCAHLQAIPVQPTVVFGSDTAQCVDCFEEEVKQRRRDHNRGQRTPCQQCHTAPTGQLRRYTMRVRHWVFLLLLCDSCAPMPPDLTPRVTTRPYC